jgi:hypothetical protein
MSIVSFRIDAESPAPVVKAEVVHSSFSERKPESVDCITSRSHRLTGSRDRISGGRWRLNWLLLHGESALSPALCDDQQMLV